MSFGEVRDSGCVDGMDGWMVDGSTRRIWCTWALRLASHRG